MDTNTTKGIAPRFTQEKLQALLQTRIDFHTKEAGRLEPEVSRLKDVAAQIETDIRVARDRSDDAMERLQVAQHAYAGAAYQLEVHKRWVTFLSFQREHLAPGTHVLELADLRVLDLVEFPGDFGMAMVPAYEKMPAHQTLKQFNRVPGLGGFGPFPGL